MVVFGQGGCIREIGCSRAIVVFCGQKWWYSGKVVVFGQSDCIRQSGCIRAKVVVFGQKWLYSGKSGSIPAKWLYL